MYIFPLVVDSIGNVMDGLRARHGDLVLAMLYNAALDAEFGWNLIVSAPWTDRMGTGNATREIARALNEGMARESQSAISRITVLKTSDPFVRDMVRLYPVTFRAGAPLPLPQLTAGEIVEGSAFVICSQLLPAHVC